MVTTATTPARILDVARELFNARGLCRVGVRDIARAAGMSPGNLAYHFATKDDLVAALWGELHALNMRTVFLALPDDFSFATLFSAAVGAMRNMLRYRFILLSRHEAVTSSPELVRLARTLRDGRRRRSDEMIARLARNGYVHGRRIAPRAEQLFEQGEMVSSGWLLAAPMRPELRDDRAIVLHYARLGCQLLEPYCTPRGARQMRDILAGRFDDAAWDAAGAHASSPDDRGPARAAASDR